MPTCRRRLRRSIPISQAFRPPKPAYKSSESDLIQSQANLEKAKLDFDRGQGLLKDGLIPKQDFDQRKTAYDAAVAAADSAKAHVASAKAQLEVVRSQLDQSKAVLVRTKDILQKTTYVSPINGIVSYLPVRLGEYVVPGIQNANGSFLMTLSDMSVVTAEVKVDETDIVNVKIGQDADVTIDAVPGKIFKGKVTEIGSQAVLRSSGLATTQTTTSNQEAKDFKVVVTLDSPPENLRPGLSTTAKIKTAERKMWLPFPFRLLPSVPARIWTKPRSCQRRIQGQCHSCCASGRRSRRSQKG